MLPPPPPAPAATKRSAKAAFALALSIGGLGLTVTAGEVDLSGKWALKDDLNWTRQNGEKLEVYLNLVHSGTTLQGKISGPEVPETPIREGSFKDGKVFFWVERILHGRGFPIRYDGALAENKLKGNGMARYGSLGSFGWEAKCITGPMSKPPPVRQEPAKPTGTSPDAARPWLVQIMRPPATAGKQDPVTLEIYQVPKGFDPARETRSGQLLKFDPAGKPPIANQVVATAAEASFRNLHAPLILRVSSKSGRLATYYVASTSYPFVVPLLVSR